MVKVEPLLSRINDFAGFLAEPFDEDATYLPLRRAETIGRPLGVKDWIAELERDHGRTLAPRKPGRKPAASVELEENGLFSKLSP